MELLVNPRLIEEEILKDTYTGIMVLTIYNRNNMDKIIFRKLDELNLDYNVLDLMSLSKKTQTKLDPGIGCNLYIFRDGKIIKHIQEFKEFSNLDTIINN